jgi:glycosyltransferase involved in cell wall biosynthesis
MKLSLIIPTIDSAHRDYLNESLQSAMKTSPDIVDEIIIFDNSKSSGFKTHLETLISNDKRVSVHSFNETFSMAECWNKGLELVKNPWHLYLHDDDILNAEEINRLDMATFEDVGFISFDFNKLVNQTRSLTSRETNLNGIIKNTPKFVSTILSTKKLKEIGGWDHNAGYFLDLLAFIKLHVLFGSKHNNTVLGDYRIHPNNASSLSKRSKGYGEKLPYVLNELYPHITQESMKKSLLFHMISFSYPSTKLSSRITARLLRYIGKETWFL